MRMCSNVSPETTTQIPPAISAGPERLLLSIKAAASALSISERTLWQLTAEGKIPSVRIGARNLYSLEALRSWIAKQSRGGGA
jgi:excisionase family DNA binding protein